MTEEKVRALFALADIPVLRLWQLPNGYCGGNIKSYADAVQPIREYHEGVTTLTREALEFLNVAVASARHPWWLVKTPFGLVEIGWRKRVININWEETPVRAVVTKDDVTSSETFVHAWGEEKALEYLKALAAVAVDPQM
jgi:hypothetical protein